MQKARRGRAKLGFDPGVSKLCGPKRRVGLHTSCTLNCGTPAVGRLCCGCAKIVKNNTLATCRNGASLGTRASRCTSVNVRCMKRGFRTDLAKCVGCLRGVVRLIRVSMAPSRGFLRMRGDGRCGGLAGTHVCNVSFAFGCRPTGSLDLTNKCDCTSPGTRCPGGNVGCVGCLPVSTASDRGTGLGIL